MGKEAATTELSMAIVGQLQSLLERGHDIQLHLHPQFEQAWWNGQCWEVSGFWRIGEIDSDRAIKLLRTGKKWLEKLIKPIIPDYQCVAFRAGGWCIQPSEAILESLRSEGFKIDSSVARGYINLVKREWAKFYDTPEMPFWYVSDDVCQQGTSTLLELPIATGQIGRWHHYSAVQKAKQYGNSGLASGCVGSYKVTSDNGIDQLRSMTSKIKRLGHVMLDFSTMPADVLIEITRQWIERFEGDCTHLPIVAIAHTKNFTSKSEQHLSDYLNWTQSEGVDFTTYGQWLKLFNKKYQSDLFNSL